MPTSGRDRSCVSDDDHLFLATFAGFIHYGAFDLLLPSWLRRFDSKFTLFYNLSHHRMRLLRRPSKGEGVNAVNPQIVLES